MLQDDDRKFMITRVKRDGAFSMASTHYHRYYEIFYLISGECNFFLNHNLYRLTKGDLVIIPAGEIHKTNYLDNHIHERFAISFYDDDLQWLTASLGVAQVKACMQAGILSVPDKRRDYIEGLMGKILFENGNRDGLYHSFMKAYFIELILFIMRCQRYEENIVKEIDVDNQLMQSVATYIYKNYNRNIHLDEVAEHFNISRSYLSKKFKVTTGFGFKEYLVNVRIKYACEMLLESNESITEIAFACGFNDSNYFGDAFKHVKGISPNKYRKNKGTL